MNGLSRLSFSIFEAISFAYTPFAEFLEARFRFEIPVNEEPSAR